MCQKKVELLSPGGGLDSLQAAIKFGADAVYLGGSAFGMRKGAKNFTEQEMEKGVFWAHQLGKKVYVTLNIFAHNSQLEPMIPFIRQLEKIQVDAVIVADLGVLEIVKEVSNLEIHVSTQAGITNYRSARQWNRLGAKRAVLARELTLIEIQEIVKKVPEMEFEVFIHGAMCMAFSGRCHLSRYMIGRDANQGDCSQSCRWSYHLIEDKRPGQEFPVEIDTNGTYLFNSKDLNTLPILGEILKTGVHSLKIEGRMKGIYYASLVTGIYRKFLDSIFSQTPFEGEPLIHLLDGISHRPYWTGFYPTGEIKEGVFKDFGVPKQKHLYCGRVLSEELDGFVRVEIKNTFDRGEVLTKISPGMEIEKIQITEIKANSSGQILEKALSGKELLIKSTPTLKPWDLIQKGFHENPNFAEILF